MILWKNRNSGFEMVARSRLIFPKIGFSTIKLIILLFFGLISMVFDIFEVPNIHFDKTIDLRIMGHLFIFFIYLYFLRTIRPLYKYTNITKIISMVIFCRFCLFLKKISMF